MMTAVLDLRMAAKIGGLNQRSYNFLCDNLITKFLSS